MKVCLQQHLPWLGQPVKAKSALVIVWITNHGASDVYKTRLKFELLRKCVNVFPTAGFQQNPFVVQVGPPGSWRFVIVWRECIRFFPSQKWRKCAIVRKVGKVFFITQQVVMFLFRWRTSLLYIWIILNHYISESFDDCWYHRAETEHSVTFSLK